MFNTSKEKKDPEQMLSDPRIIGPGYWSNIHLKAKYAVDDKTKQEFIAYMWFLADTFPCGNCRKHIRQYLNDHPFDHFYNLRNNKGEEIGMFKWSWMFHNTVNNRIHKPHMEWVTAWGMYNSDIEPCTDCGDKEEEINVQDKPDTNKIIQGYFMRKGIEENISRLS